VAHCFAAPRHVKHVTQAVMDFKLADPLDNGLPQSDLVPTLKYAS
jgi:hypothetical protein